MSDYGSGGVGWGQGFQNETIPEFHSRVFSFSLYNDNVYSYVIKNSDFIYWLIHLKRNGNSKTFIKA